MLAFCLAVVDLLLIEFADSQKECHSTFYEFRLRLNIKRIAKPESFGRPQVRKRKYLKADREGRGVLDIQMLFS